MTNYEKIKNMSVDEMAEFLVNTNTICSFCIYDANGKCHSLDDDEIQMCFKGNKEWLEREAEKE